MSIASRVSGYWGEKLFPDGFILIEPRVAEKVIALIINDEFEAAEELARLLLVLERGIEAEIPAEGLGTCPATGETIGMMIELAYLESKNYNVSLREWRDALAGTEFVAGCKLQVGGSERGRTKGRPSMKGARASKRKGRS